MDKEERRFKKIEIGILILALIFEIIILAFQVNLLFKQKDILERTTSLNQANPEIFESPENLVLNSNQLVDYPYHKSLEESWGRIGLKIINFGQIDTYDFGCFYSIKGEKNDSLRASFNIKEIPKNETYKFGNIRSEELKEVTLHIQDSTCFSSEGKSCINPKLSGNYTILLKCECAGCKDRYLIKPINFCIYQENETKECLQKGWEGYNQFYSR